MPTLMKNAWEEIQTKNRNKVKRPNQLLPNCRDTKTDIKIFLMMTHPGVLQEFPKI